jgi:TolA-binding protein
MFVLLNFLFILKVIKIWSIDMRFIILLISCILIGLLSPPTSLNAQPQTDTESLERLIKDISELEFQLALTAHVEKLLTTYGVQEIPKERFLITLMSLVNKETERRIKNPKTIRDNYFTELKNQIEELQTLKERLANSNISELNSFIDELEVRMRFSLKSGTLDYRKKNIFDDALQLLYLAEEMIKLDQISQPNQLNRRISNSKDKLLSAFEEVGNIDDVTLDVAPNIYNLFEDWRKTENIRYDARLIDVKIARTNLIKSGSVEQVLRMFNDQLRYAYILFNYNKYDLADRLLEDLITSYRTAGVKDFEDIYYYWGESNFALSRYIRAEEIFNTMLKEYPNSIFASKVIGRLMQISYKLEKGDEVLNYYSRYQSVASPNEKDYIDNLFIVALTFYNKADLNSAVEILSSFPQDNPYYHLSQYLIGTIYASGQNYETANEIFQKLISSKDTPFDLYCRSLYKLALMSYENSAFINSIEYLKQIPESFSRYDKVLNVFAWSFFRLEQLNSSVLAQPDYTQAKEYAKRLVNEYFASDHKMEAESLLAYIYQLELNPEIARELFRDVYETKLKKASIDQFLEEKSNLDSLMVEAKVLEEKALKQNDVSAYIKASDMSADLENKMFDMELSESSAVGSAVTVELNKILNQLSELNQLKEQAKQDNNTRALMKIDSNIVRLTDVINMFPESYLQSALAYNWFDAYPIARNKSENEYHNAKNRTLRNEIMSEIYGIDSQIAALRKEVDNAITQGNFKKVAQLEHEISRLFQLRKEFDSLYTETFQLNTEQPYAEFDKWGDFGAFGIIDVDFGERNRIQQKMTDVSETYNSVVGILEKRREVIDDIFKRIEAQIRFMTMKARLEERVRLRAERERSFRESYFDKRTSEFEEEQ